MSKILGVAGLFILYRELTKVVSPKTVVTSGDSQLGLTQEETERQQERERQRKIAEEESVARQRERDRIAAEEKKRLDNLFFARQAEIKANPPNCGFGRSPRLQGAGTKEFPYSWECVLTGF